MNIDEHGAEKNEAYEVGACCCGWTSATLIPRQRGHSDGTLHSYNPCLCFIISHDYMYRDEIKKTNVRDIRINVDTSEMSKLCHKNQE